MALTNAEKQKLYRMKKLGYDKQECPPDVTNEECLAWARGLWQRYADDQGPRLQPDPKMKGKLRLQMAEK